ncbi:MAG: hypothetical protein ACTSQE_12440 [Candidatus Heimdallarchaeaceae archaeon]
MAVTGTLEQIRAKVRRLVGMPSVNQLTVEELDDYINDFYQYDFPAHVKTWNLTTALPPIWGPDDTLIPDQAIYVYDWNVFTNMGPPCYVGGYEIQYYQDQESFFNIFPTRMLRQQLSTGTGIAGPYGGTLTNTPILRSGIFMSAMDNAGNSLHCDANAAGVLSGDVAAGGTINYQTGVVAGLTWNGVIAVGEPIWAQTMTYTTGRPEAVLFYDGVLLFYPVPDIAYEFSCRVNQVPDALTVAGDQPLVRDWWNLIAYGAALKIFAENLDMESYAKIMPLFDKHLMLVERRTLCQLKNQRTSTIYTNQWPGSTSFRSNI